MLEALRAAVLGIVQGLTEFLPVSSSGHLEIAKYLLGEESVGSESLMLTIVLHAATAIGTLFVFRKDVWDILKEIFSKPWNEGQEFTLKVIISMIPAAIVGYFFEQSLALLFEGQLMFVGLMLFVTAVLLFFADYSKRNDRAVGRWDALWIGLGQMVAILPGISRSGATIATSIFLGIDRYKAARFSFLMVVPLILGKMGYELVNGGPVNTAVSESALLVGFMAALISGIVACRWMVILVTRSKLRWFGMYCIAAGVFAIVLSFLAHE